MANKNNSEFLDNVEYKDVLQEEIQNFLEKESAIDEKFDKKQKKLSKFKRTPLEIINRLLFFLFLGSFILSLIHI